MIGQSQSKLEFFKYLEVNSCKTVADEGMNVILRGSTFMRKESKTMQNVLALDSGKID